MRIRRFVLASVCTAAMAAPLHAASVFSHAYELTLDGGGEFGFNAPRVTFTNVGDARITAIVVTLNDPAYNFDSVVQPVADGVTASLVRGDDQNNAERTQSVEIAFSGFDTDDSWSALADLDADTFAGKDGSIEDARAILFGSDRAKVASVLVTFEDGTQLGTLLPAGFVDDAGVGDGVTFESDGDVYSLVHAINVDTGVIIPTPAAAGAGLVLLGGCIARRRRG